jgi:hypothetical protein
MNRKMVYIPQEIACKTVIVTEPYVCPIPTVKYPDIPDITFVGTNGECQITIDVGDGNTIVGLAPNTSQSFIRVDTGSGWVYLDEYVDSMVSLQTINTAWEMDVSTDYLVHVEAQIISSCDNTSSGVISSEDVQYIAPAVCPTPTISFPDTPDISFDADNIAHCHMTVDAGAGEVLDLVYGDVFVNDGVSSYVTPTITPPLNTTSQIQNVELTWPMQASDSAVYVTVQLYNTCLESALSASSPVAYTHVPLEADITAISITIPDTCVAPCDADISITWQNVGTATGIFTPGYTVDRVLYQDPDGPVEMVDGATHTWNTVTTLPTAKIYTICPYPN